MKKSKKTIKIEVESTIVKDWPKTKGWLKNGLTNEIKAIKMKRQMKGQTRTWEEKRSKIRDEIENMTNI